MNADRPVTIEEITASAEAQIRAMERVAANAMRRSAIFERYARMLRKDRDVTTRHHWRITGDIS